LCLDEFPFAKNIIALDVYQAAPDIHVSDLIKSWVRAHLFLLLPPFGACSPVLCRVLPTDTSGKVSANRLPENEKLSGKPSGVLNPADFLFPSVFPTAQ
jgi:hypothetical protein